MKQYKLEENKIVDADGNVLIESNNIEQLNNVLTAINDLKTKLEFDIIGCYSKHKLNEDLKKDATNIVFVDVNFLKRVNDKYGHSKGDSLLVKVVNILKKFGNVYRQGGDEFVLLVENDKTLAKFVRLYKNTKLFSFGICLKSEFENIGQAYCLADKRMYVHKRLQHKKMGEKNFN